MSNELTTPPGEDTELPPPSESHILRVGRRLATIREELGRAYGEIEWSQTAVAQKTGLTQNTITRMEHGMPGRVENWLKVLMLYQSRGYNINWMLTDNNSLTSKFQLDEAIHSQSGHLREQMLKHLDELDQTLNEKIEAIRKQLLKVGRN